MNPKVIVVDGKTYHRVDEMPADIREKYEQAMGSLGDANNHQIPDAFETLNISADKDKEARARYEEAIGKLDANRNGTPDVVDGMMNASTQTAMSIAPDTSSGWVLLLASLLWFALCPAGAAGIWYFFLR